jgi:hypothetical protein
MPIRRTTWVQRINSLLAMQEVISPFEARETADGTDSIELLNPQIQEGFNLTRCAIRSASSYSGGI